MSRRATTLALVLLLGTLPGCLEADGEARIDARGGGTFVETVTIHRKQVAQALELLHERIDGVGSDDDPPALDPFRLLDPAKRLARLRNADGLDGVTLARSTPDEDTRRYVLRGTFRDLRALFEAGPTDDLEAALWPVRDGTAWRLESRSLFDDEELDAAARATLLQFRRELLAPYRAALADLVIRRTLVFPAPVLDTNGTLGDDGRTVTWTLRYADLADPRALRQMVVFAAADGLALEAFGRRPAAPPAAPEPDTPGPAADER